MIRSDGQIPFSVFRPIAGGDAKHGRLTTHAFSVVLFLVFIAAILVTLMVGTGIYQRLVTQQRSIDDTRLALSLISNSVRANDAVGVVASGTGPEGPSLVLVERLPTGNCETRIYKFGGKVLEEYAVEGTPYTPEKATVVASSDTFSFRYDDGLLSITTDAGTVDVALRCAGGDA